MATVQWRPDINSMTVPQSWRIRFLPRNIASRKDIAADIAKKHPNYNAELAEAILKAAEECISERLRNGEQVTMEGSFSYALSFTGRLDSADDPLPPLTECLQVRIYALPHFVDDLRQTVQAERLPPEKKVPLINTAQDSLLKLNDVLNPAGVMQLSGSDLYFDQENGGGECVIEGTESGRAVQTRLISVANSTILLMPDIPEQTQPWNNEYTISVSTRYSERGTLRSGTYSRMLRAPLAVTKLGHPNPPEVGILSGKESSANVSIIGGSVTADEMLRLQVILDLRQDCLLFSLIDMKEGGRTGAAASVTANGNVTLHGFSGSAVSSLTVRVNNYASLKEMSRNDYGGRIVDVLDIKTA